MGELGIPLGAEHAKVIGTIQEQKKQIRHELCISQDASHAELIQRIITLNGIRGKPLEPTETNREIIKQHFLISEVGREVRTRMLKLEKQNRELEGKLSEARSTQNNHTRKELPNELAQRIKVLEKQNENLTRELTNTKARLKQNNHGVIERKEAAPPQTVTTTCEEDNYEDDFNAVWHLMVTEGIVVQKNVSERSKDRRRAIDIGIHEYLAKSDAAVDKARKLLTLEQMKSEDLKTWNAWIGKHQSGTRTCTDTKLPTLEPDTISLDAITKTIDLLKNEVKKLRPDSECHDKLRKVLSVENIGEIRIEIEKLRTQRAKVLGTLHEDDDKVTNITIGVTNLLDKLKVSRKSEESMRKRLEQMTQTNYASRLHAMKELAQKMVEAVDTFKKGKMERHGLGDFYTLPTEKLYKDMNGVFK